MTRPAAPDALERLVAREIARCAQARETVISERQLRAFAGRVVRWAARDVRRLRLGATDDWYFPDGRSGRERFNEGIDRAADRRPRGGGTVVSEKLVNDTLAIECLLQAADDYADARREHDEARDAYTGYSWGYYGRHLVEAKEKAAAEFMVRLNAYVDARVAAAFAVRAEADHG